MKITTTQYIHEVLHWDGTIRYIPRGCDMSSSGSTNWGTLVATVEVEIEFELPANHNPILEAVKGIEKQREQLYDKFKSADALLNNKINDLLMIGHQEAA